MKTRTLPGALWLALACSNTILGCTEQPSVIVPNRVLDRPIDLAIGCYRTREGVVEAVGLDQCELNGRPKPRCNDESANQLVGFVGNSGRNEVALFRRCDRESAIVDLDPQTPGYSLLPVGRIPTRIIATRGGCAVATANVGSCDFSRIDGVGLAAFALDHAIKPTVGGLVSTVVPHLGNGDPLSAKPGDMIAGRGGSELPSSDDGGFGEDGEGPLACGDGASDTIYATFPSCQLVAEISLATGEILQSRRFVTGSDGRIEVEDGGLDPQCPIDCPAQFPNAALPPRDPIDAAGFVPAALTLVAPVPIPTSDGEPSTENWINETALFVGGRNADDIFEIRVDEDGQWAEPGETRRLALEDPRGVLAIRPTPLVPLVGSSGTNELFQFLYVVAGDGSTHVVSRSPDPEVLGVECDTQVDPSLFGGVMPACTEIVPDAPQPDAGRRPFAAGPGIRVGGGAAITDWAFFDYVPSDSEDSSIDEDQGGAPFGTPDPQVVGVGITSFGRVIYAAIDQYQQAEKDTTIDPLRLLDVSIPPHSLWPQVDPTADPGGDSGALVALPNVEDQVPTRVLSGPDDSTQVLAPTLRRIDLAYALVEPASNELETISRAFAVGPEEAEASGADALANIDRLGSYSEDDVETTLYTQPVPRVAVRDYRQWVFGNQTWSLDWEGSIPGTRSATGRLECDREVEGFRGALCALDPNDDRAASRLVDESAAFCDAGVLAGDKVVLLGCQTDAECGLGQRCLTEPTAASTATGICISAGAFEERYEELRTFCAPFINDPCGRPRREFLITRAFQNYLELQAMDVEEQSFLRIVESEDDPEAPVEFNEHVDRFTCLPLLTDETAPKVACDETLPCAEGETCAVDGVCRRCAAGEPDCLDCDDDSDCVDDAASGGDFGPDAICSDGRCRRPCEPGEAECTLAPLPGSMCFTELIDYVVRARHSFLVTGNPTAPFFTDRVTTRAAALGDTGPFADECVEDDRFSRLLTSRLRLGADEESTWNDPAYPILDCPNGGADQAGPGDPNPCRITTTRSSNPNSRFHVFEFRGQGDTPPEEGRVEAIRFSNPFMSLTLDLTNLLALGLGPEQVPDVAWPTAFAEFRRARIPEGYQEYFQAEGGYSPWSETVVGGEAPLIYPVRIVPEAGANVAYVVDAGGRGGALGVRGQVFRMLVDQVDTGALADIEFQVQ